MTAHDNALLVWCCPATPSFSFTLSITGPLQPIIMPRNTNMSKAATEGTSNTK